MPKPQYRIIVDDGLGGLERELNELAQQGFRPILMAILPKISRIATAARR
jgi:hypothetical protein